MGTGLDKPRSIAFHWTANVFFAGVAILAGAAFGEPITRQTLRWLLPLVVLGALAFVPITRRWEAGAIARRVAADSARQPREDGIDPAE